MINESLGSFDTPAWMGEIRGCQKVLPQRREAKVKTIRKPTAKHRVPCFLWVCAKAREAAQDHCLELRDKPETGQMVLTGRPETRGGIHRLLKQEVLGIRSGM